MAIPILIAIGSNRRHGVYGRPEAVVRAAVAALANRGLVVTAVSGVYATAPLGPGGRRFANAAAAVVTELPLLAVLGALQAIEREFGRRGGKRWGDRVVDLDIVGAGDVVLRGRGLMVPHPGVAGRRFVLDPLVEIAPDWRHPVLHATVRQLRFRSMRSKSRVRAVRRVGP